MANLRLDRKTLARLLQNDHEAIVAFENLFTKAGTDTPKTVDEIAILAGTASSFAALALEMLADLTSRVEQSEALPAVPAFPEPDFAPKFYWGSMAEQNADSVDITGGTISGVTFLGLTTASVAPSTNRNYVTDVQLVVITNTSGTNTGDQTNITGNAGTATVLQTARNINGISFNGSANITIVDTTRALLAGSTTQAFSTAALTVAGLADISAAGAGQIKFPATQNPSADAHTLDDYEEGTFTATLVTTGTQPATPPTSTAYYTKVGRLVTVHVGFTAFTISGATGNISLTGLPFTPASIPAIGPCWTWLMGATPMVGRIDTGTATIFLQAQTDNNGIPVTNGSGQYLYGTFTYLA
jgi:hypothetical protein